MGLFQVVCLGLLAVIAQTQELQNCSVDSSPVVIASTEDAADLATSILDCPGGDFAVEWVGKVVVEETFYVTGGTSLNITGAGPTAIADGGDSTQLFYVEGGSSLHLSDVTLSNGSAIGDGGAIYANQSTVSLSGNMSFISNSAGEDGGAIYAYYSTVSWGGDRTEFSVNVARDNGGALVLMDCDPDIEYEPIIGTAFTNNRAGFSGGAIYFENCEVALNLTDVTFTSNLAGDAGGAVAAYNAGDMSDPAMFSGCIFSNNTAGGTGGAVETYSGFQEFISCEFQGNSADVGGAMRLGGTTDINSCSFLSNSASSSGFALAVTRSTFIGNSSFDTNELYCEYSYRTDTEQQGATRFEAVCLDCHGWDDCLGCSIKNPGVTSTCEAILEHTGFESGLSMEMLQIDAGYWRATNKSYNILACYNADACRGGLTGAESYCASGYMGPYCAVCENDYAPLLGHTCTRCSSSRRRGLVAATVLAALVAVIAVVTMLKFFLSTEVAEGNIECFRRWVLRAVPVQALKIIVVVWQILTQFADAASVTYPGVYEDFLRPIEMVNFDLGSVLAAGCLWSGVDFYDRLLVSTLGPLIVVGFLAMTHLIAVRRNSSESAVEKIRHKHQTALLLVTFLVYSSVSSMLFQTFACETLDDGVEYLRADYRIHCTDAKHKAFEVYAGFMVFVYPLGIPLLYAVLLFQRRDVLAKDDEKRTDADKTVAQPISGLWEAYRPERFYYEVVECGRRILLTGVVVFIFPNTAAQIAITMLIAFFFFAVFEVLSPYTSESDMWLSRGGHVIVFLSMFDLLLLKVDVSGERDQSQAAFAGVLVAGHVLMVLAIVVEVIALCYASRKKKVVEGEEEASERPRVGSDDVPAFESAPAPWRSFFRQGSVSEKTGPTRSVSGTVVTTGGP